MTDKIKLSEIRAQFPQLKDVDDATLLGAVHKEYFGDMPRGDFLNSIDYDTSRIDPTAGMSTTQKALAGVGSGMASVVRALGGGRAVAALDLPGTKEEAEHNDGPLMKTRAGRWGNIGGKVAAILPVALVPGANTYTGAAGLGAITSAATTEGDLKDRAKAGAIGTITGPAGKFVGDTLARAIRGFVPKTDAAKALPEDVVNSATLGQIADRNTLAGKIASATEEKLKSVPILGNVVERARSRGAENWRDAMIREGTPEGFIPAAGTTRERLAEIYGEFRKRYTDALRGKTVNPSQLFESQALKMTSNPRTGLSQEQGEAVLENVMRNYRSRFEGVPGQNTGSTAVATGPAPGVPVSMRADLAKDFEAFLGDQARQYGRTQGISNPEMSKLYGDLERAWTASYRRQLGPQVRAELQPLDARYAPYKTVERAAGSVAAENGNFTPAQLVNAVAARTGKAKFARGDGLLADEAQAGKTMFQDHLANSGTTDRALQASSIGGLVLDPLTTAKVYGATATALPLFTTQTGKRMMTGDAATQLLLQRLRAPELLEYAGVPGAEFGTAVNQLGGNR